MHRFIFYIVLVLICFSCSQNANQLSFISIDLDVIKENNPDINIDSLISTVLNNKSDLIEINPCVKDQIIDINNKYLILSENLRVPNSTNCNSLLLVNKNILELLVSSRYVIENKIFEIDSNIISWYKFKYLKSGYIFYVFTINAQLNLNNEQTKLIAFYLLDKINEVSAGAPVIILNTEISNSLRMNHFITNKWIDSYNFNAVNNNTNNCVKFFVNDFFKVRNLNSDTLTATSYCNIHVKFSLNMQKVKKNSTGNQLNELLIK